MANSKISNGVVLAGLLGGLAFTGLAGAAPFCVSTAGELSIALAMAAGNGEDDTVQIVQGIYLGNFLYDASESHDLTIEGGYTPGCAGRVVNPANTVLDGQRRDAVLDLSGLEAVNFSVDGLTLQNGSRPFRNGGGLEAVTEGETVLTNNIISGNTAHIGGGVRAIYGTVTLTANLIRNNTAQFGGGVVAGGDIVTLTDNTIRDNTAQDLGGGFMTSSLSPNTIVTLTNNTITDNIVDSEGGGVFALGGTIDLTDNLISGNTAFLSNGGGVYLTGNMVTLTGNTIRDNTAALDWGWGGGIDATGGTVALANNLISGNKALRGGGMSIEGDKVALSNNTISGNTADNAGGVDAYGPGANATITLTNNTISDNVADRDGGGVLAEGAGGISLTDNLFAGNTAGDDGGGALAGGNWVTLTNNLISSNTASDTGGGVYAWAHGTVTLTNNTVSGNSAAGGTWQQGGGLLLALYDEAARANIYNNIVWNNTAMGGADLYIENDGDGDSLASPVNLFHNDFDQSTAGFFATIPFPIDPSNLNNLNPLFVSAAAGDYHLTAGSPCVDAGDNAAPGLPPTDKEGNVRIANGVVDMGAYEYQGEPAHGPVVYLEEPAPGSVYSGVSNLRGWAVAPVAIDHVELRVDGAFVANVPSGGLRPDVAAAFPTYPNAAQSGFSMAFNYSEFPAGAHTVTVRAVTGSGGFKNATATFNVTRFPTPFISDPAAVTLAGATCTHDSNALYLNNLMVQGMPYDLTLRWRTATQGFATTQILSSSSAVWSTPLTGADSWLPWQDPVAETWEASGFEIWASNSDSQLVQAPAPPLPGSGIVMHLEEPASGSVYSGVSNLRGWAVAPVAIDHVELRVDGAFVANVPSGGLRPDVAAAYPTYPNAAQSGFSMAFNYSELAAGVHTVTVRAVTGSGGFKTDMAAFNVTRFPTPFISNPAAVNLAGATCSHDSNALYLDNLMVQRMPYDLTLRWRTATQGLAITNIAQ